MSALGISMGACFCVRLHKTLVEAVCAHLNLTDFLPTALRQVLFTFIRHLDIRPCPTYVGAVSTLNGDFLDFFVFIGSDATAFDTVPDLQTTAAYIENHLRAHFEHLLAEDATHLLHSLTVSWEPNLLVTAE
ncbi:hypothetical protein [Bat adenovirus 2]|uniref:Uncharacterized protein n=2 Tax=Mastadenovirus TaxID=10509 RepID=G1FQP3_9ADEN|nr:hypothetical protein BatAdV2_gp30 [Bat adenovirus 2]AEM06290.1 hypothetical protein [Bat adenovirus 2]QDA77070.1 ORFA [Bat mastadenovirus B]QRV11602.1 hypothetical protein [Bat mastadenovirus]